MPPSRSDPVALRPLQGLNSEGREWGVGSVVVDFCVFGAPRFSVNGARKPFKIYVFLVAHDCGYPLSRYTCRAARVAADFLDFIAFCRCSTGVALHPLKILVSHLPPPCPGRCRTEIWVWKGVALHGGVAATVAGVALHCATKYVFWDLWTEHRGTPKKNENQRRRIQPPILSPLSFYKGRKRYVNNSSVPTWYLDVLNRGSLFTTIRIAKTHPLGAPYAPSHSSDRPPPQLWMTPPPLCLRPLLISISISSRVPDFGRAHVGPWYARGCEAYGGRKTYERTRPPKNSGPLLLKSFWSAQSWMFVQDKQSNDTPWRP